MYKVIFYCIVLLCFNIYLNSSTISINTMIVSERKLLKTNHKAACLFQSKSETEFNVKYNPRKYDEIYFYHTRKAGGTTISKYLQKVTNIYKQNYSKTEGKRMIQKQNSRIFYVTVLREPVERSISNFKYDSRWNCKNIVYHYDNITAENANPFSDWIDKHKNENRKKLWDCSANCYASWFSSSKKLKKSKELIIDEAMRNLKTFDLILQTRFMSNIEYLKQIETFFGVTGYKTRSAFCVKASHNANLKFPLNISTSELQELTNQNQIDSIIFQNITNCQKP